MRFQNKIVVIATSGGSIGIECARMLQGEGAKVVFLVSDKSETAGMVESDTCKIVSVDRFYDEAEMEVKIRDALSEFGAADLVVTCLAAQPPAFVWNEIPEDEAHRYFDEIMTGVQTVLKYTVRHDRAGERKRCCGGEHLRTYWSEGGECDECRRACGAWRTDP